MVGQLVPIIISSRPYLEHRSYDDVQREAQGLVWGSANPEFWFYEWLLRRFANLSLSFNFEFLLTVSQCLFMQVFKGCVTNREILASEL